MTVIATSTAVTATAYSNQRKVDRCQNGVLWSVAYRANFKAFYFWFSTDNGASWTHDSKVFATEYGDINYTPNGSLFIDVDDYAHFVYRHGEDGYIYYARGTPNAARTAYTWSGSQEIYNNTTMDYPDIIAHREGTGWVAHCVFSFASGSNNRTYYRKVDVASGGGLTVGALTEIGDGSYSNSNHTWPSIDFNHTGDGKTVAGSTPHLYAAWSAGAAGSGKGIRFKKATYSGGSWTWGTEREIDSTQYVANTSNWLACLFDGTQIIMSGSVYSGSQISLLLYERDAADTNTTVHTLLSNFAADGPYNGSFSYDADGNIYILGRTNNTPRVLQYYKWVRLTSFLESPIIIDTDSGSAWVSAKRGYSNSHIEFIYTDGDASPYDVTYGSIVLNNPPNVPTNLAVTSASADSTPVFSASVSDPDAGNEVKARFEISTGAGSVIDTVDSSFVTDSGTVTAEYTSALTLGEYRVRAKAIDAPGKESAYTDYINFDISFFAAGVGGFITKGTVPTKTEAQGCWTVNDIHGYRNNDRWPVV